MQTATTVPCSPMDYFCVFASHTIVHNSLISIIEIKDLSSVINITDDQFKARYTHTTKRIGTPLNVLSYRWN